MDNFIELKKPTARQQIDHDGCDLMESGDSIPTYTQMDPTKSTMIPSVPSNDHGMVDMMMESTTIQSYNHGSDITDHLDSGIGTASTVNRAPTTPCPNYDYNQPQMNDTNNQSQQMSSSPPMTQYSSFQPLGNTPQFVNNIAPSPHNAQPQVPTVSQYNNNDNTNNINIESDIMNGQIVNGHDLIEKFEGIMCQPKDDVVVLTNSVILLFRFSIDSVRGYDVCTAMSSSSLIMEKLYSIINNYDGHDLNKTMLCYATGNLTSLSKFEESREIMLTHNGTCSTENTNINEPSPAVKSLLRTLQIDDINVIIFAITAIHNLLLDGRPKVQEIAKEQIKHGLRDILMLLDNQCLAHNHEFKVIVLDCLQILAYRNPENKLIIKRSDGPRLILQTIQQNLENPSEELIETASRVLKSLSACPDNKIDIIRYNGIEILTLCIGTSNPDILKTCLWTLRNLSDVMSNNESEHINYIMQLIDRILKILKDYADEPSIITCALGLLANLTCNNERIKQRICYYNGFEILIRTIGIALRDPREFYIVDKEILEPAICALCHLMNQTDEPMLAERVSEYISANDYIFQLILNPNRSIDLCKAMNKLYSLTGRS